MGVTIIMLVVFGAAVVVLVARLATRNARRRPAAAASSSDGVWLFADGGSHCDPGTAGCDGGGADGGLPSPRSTRR